MRELRGVWYAQVTVDFIEGGSGHKTWRLPPCKGETEATRFKDELVKELATTREKFPKKGTAKFTPKGSAPGPTETFGSYFRRWIEDRKRIKEWAKDEQRIRDHVLPILRDVTMASLETDQAPLRAVAVALDERVQDPAVKFTASTACKVWEAVTALFKTASRSNKDALRVLKVNPTDIVKLGITKGRKKSKQWLFPREFGRLVEHKRVPVEWREAYAVATYLVLRVAELRAIWCEDFDLEARRVHVHRAAKKGSVRSFRYEDAVHPLIVALVARAGGTGPLFDLPEEIPQGAGRKAQKQAIGEGKQARRLRKHLLWAGVTRHALHHTEGNSLRITFHDLRATGITWMAMRGDSYIAIRDRAGHDDPEQTNRYMRRASEAGEAGTPFPPLDALLANGVPIGEHAAPGSDSFLKTGTYEWSRGGSNPSTSALSAENVGVSAPEPCQNCALGTPVRHSVRQWEAPKKLGPTPQAQPAAWSLALALEGALRRAEHRGRAVQPAALGAPLAAAVGHGEAVPRKGARRAG